MLAKKLKLKINSLEVGTTPLLVPSMSSHINVEYNETIEALSAIVDGPMLISAYDYYYAEGLSINYPDLIFLDSGGYECNKDKEISDSGFYKPQEIDWTRTIHAKVVNEWSNEIPTVVISYDHPSERYPIKGQIKLAKELFENKNDVIKEILLKPVSQDAIRVKPEQVIENLNQLSYFDIVGFTDKELGFSVFKRMENIAKIRKAMNKENLNIPIHIFGSLDTITTPLYFLSGADIFDGLTWLRHIFHEGNTLYLDSFGPKKYGPDENIRKIWIQTAFYNYRYLRRLKTSL